MKLAQQKRWSAARSALIRGANICPKQKRFPIEIAGIAFEERKYPEAARWLHKGLHLDPSDKYANNFAGTVYYLMGNLPAALKYWNRIGKPKIISLDLDSALKIRPLILGRAFAFSPASLITLQQFETTRARLNAFKIFPTYRISLQARPNNSFDANFNAVERDGFGSDRWSALIATLSGIPYETIYPAYYNLQHSAMNTTSLLRWDDQKRRAWVSLSGPLHQLPQYRWNIAFDARNENWAIRRSFTGEAPVLGSLNLQKQKFQFSLTDYTSGRFRWSAGAEISHRTYRNIQDGTALTPNMVLPGTALEFIISTSGKPLDQPQRRLSITTKVSSAIGRIWSAPSQVFEKLQGSAKLRWFPSPDSDRWEITQQLHGGGLLGAAPFDQLFMLGIERDNTLWLRGDLGDRDGRKGSAPMGTRYFLANSDVYRRLFGNGLIDVQAGPLFDIGRMGAPTFGLTVHQWIFDAGVEARIKILGTRVILSWGHDLRTGQNAIFSTAQ